MAHDHAYAGGATGAGARRLAWAFAITASFFVIEVVAAFLTGSLALLSDAAHLFTDCAALGIALTATRLAQRPADARRTFGYQRFEVLGAALNALLLLAAAGYIVFEAFQRWNNPVAINVGGMLAVAAAGLAANIVAALLLAPARGENLNVRGAYLEVLADLVSSIGVIVAAVAILLTGMLWIDAAIALAIALWVLPRAIALLRSSAHILLEGVPEHIDLAQVRQAILGMPNVADLHDLHVWSLASTEPSLSVHVVLGEPRGTDVARRAIVAMLDERFHIHHATVQVETSACEKEPGLHA